MKLKASLAVCSVALLAACGGGSSGTSNFQTLGNQGIDLINRYQTATVTPVQNMPTGTFNYSGVAAYSAISSINPTTILNNALALSSVNLSANFTNNTLTGSLSNFIDSQNYTASGSVPLTGTISGNGFTASGSAILVSSFDNSNYFTSANITQGVFIGTQAQAAEGVMSATYGPVSGSGYFLAER
jgi:hypothetical protein